jgi:hypothetical protein
VSADGDCGECRQFSSAAGRPRAEHICSTRAFPGGRSTLKASPSRHAKQRERGTSELQRQVRSRCPAIGPQCPITQGTRQERHAGRGSRLATLQFSSSTLTFVAPKTAHCKEDLEFNLGCVDEVDAPAGGMDHARRSGESGCLRLPGPGIVRWRGARGIDEVPPEVVLGGERVVSLTAERDVLFGGLTAAGEGVQVMELEPMGLRATSPRVIGERAACLVAFEDGASNLCADVSSAPARNDRLMAPTLRSSRRSPPGAVRPLLWSGSTRFAILEGGQPVTADEVASSRRTSGA